MKTYNFDKLMSYNPTIYESFINSKGQNIDLVEHPLQGDMATIIVVCKDLKLASDSSFFDTHDMLADHKEYEPSFIDGKLYIGELES